jgi:hypothetical protein
MLLSRSWTQRSLFRCQEGYRTARSVGPGDTLSPTRFSDITFDVADIVG